MLSSFISSPWTLKMLFLFSAEPAWGAPKRHETGRVPPTGHPGQDPSRKPTPGHVRTQHPQPARQPLTGRGGCPATGGPQQHGNCGTTRGLHGDRGYHRRLLWPTSRHIVGICWLFRRIQTAVWIAASFFTRFVTQVTKKYSYMHYCIEIWICCLKG